jgi:exodeoxyribonuclease V alpha subunit
MSPPELQRLREAGLLGELDLQFAALIGRLADDESRELALGAALASHWSTGGHVCLELEQVAGRGLAPEHPDLIAPELADWIRALAESPVVGAPGDYRPLILDPAGRLYLHRYWRYESELAAELAARAGEPVTGLDRERLAAGLRELFPAQTGIRPDWQQLAAAQALLRRFCVISGGPGTGKTSTVVRILALLRQQSGGDRLKIGLAAPTGKAAARMQESIRAAKQRLGLAPELVAAIPDAAQTLHRLLGWRPDGAGFRYGRDNPLPLDLLIVDEASMVDLALMARLLRALGPDTRLILLGDRDQLASVEAGAVLGDICGPVPGFSPAFAAQLGALTGAEAPAAAGRPPPLADCLAVLRHSYRFGADSGIGRLAQAVNQGRGEAACALLAAREPADIAWLDPGLEPAGAALDGYREYLQLLAAGAEPGQVFAAFARFQVLCALRQGPFGVAGLNQAIETGLQRAGLIAPRAGWYPGRPVMVVRNDYNLHLYNGDIGITVADPQRPGRLQVCFLSADGALRRLAPARLPPHETVYAMTVHKSQGSEFEQVLLVLPDADNPLLTRELVYTGITRARTGFRLRAPAGLLALAVGRRLARASGLRDALWNGAA